MSRWRCVAEGQVSLSAELEPVLRCALSCQTELLQLRHLASEQRKLIHALSTEQRGEWERGRSWR